MGKKSTRSGRKGTKRRMVPGENGQMVELVLVKPTGKGTIDPRLIRAAVRRVRDARLKAAGQSPA